MGGGVAIPTNIPVVTTLSPSGGDDSVQIQAAIDSLAAQPLGTNGFRGAIYLNPGVYAMSNGLNVTASGIVLRGAGWSTNGTLLHLLVSHVLWTVNNPSGVGRSEVANTQHNIVSPYVPLGANWFTMDSTSNWSVGDDIVIYRPSTTTWINAINTSTEYPISWKAGQVDLSVERKIVAIEGKPRIGKSMRRFSAPSTSNTAAVTSTNTHTTVVSKMSGWKTFAPIARRAWTLTVTPPENWLPTTA